MFDLDAYVERIGLQGRPGLSEIHQAHVSTIPFENLDPHRGVPVSLEEEALERKLVTGRRGGYCFEQNLVLKAALEALGAQVEPMLARVRRGARYGSVRPRTHLLLRVTVEGAVWHADAGFGVGSLLEPIPFGPGQEHELSGWRVRVVEDGAELGAPGVEDGGWVDLYGFVPEPVPLADIRDQQLVHVHAPESRRLRHRPDRRQAPRRWHPRVAQRLGQRALTPRADAVGHDHHARHAEIPGLLETVFGLLGFVQAEDRTVPGDLRLAGT